jgi:hypothetical protein
MSSCYYLINARELRMIPPSAGITRFNWYETVSCFQFLDLAPIWYLLVCYRCDCWSSYWFQQPHRLSGEANSACTGMVNSNRVTFTIGATLTLHYSTPWQRRFVWKEADSTDVAGFQEWEEPRGPSFCVVNSTSDTVSKFLPSRSDRACVEIFAYKSLLLHKYTPLPPWPFWEAIRRCSSWYVVLLTMNRYSLPI